MADPEEAVVRRQIETTLRTMALSTLVGLVVIVVIAVAVPSIRGVMILVGVAYLLSSLAARWYLRRRFLSRLRGPAGGLAELEFGAGSVKRPARTRARWICRWSSSRRGAGR